MAKAKVLLGRSLYRSESKTVKEYWSTIYNFLTWCCATLFGFVSVNTTRASTRPRHYTLHRYHVQLHRVSASISIIVSASARGLCKKRQTNKQQQQQEAQEHTSPLMSCRSDQVAGDHKLLVRGRKEKVDTCARHTCSHGSPVSHI